MIKNFLCYLGLHKWFYYSTSRECEWCLKKQNSYVYSDAGEPYLEIDWLDN
jgi:hypothetical protein